MTFAQRLDCERDELAELSRLPIGLRKEAIDLIDYILLFSPPDATHAYALAKDSAGPLEISDEGLRLARSLIARAEHRAN
jgi:hypothetical protein